MAKEDVHKCIDETIVPNGKKAITAESMNNLLHLMADEGGGGSSILMARLGNALDSEYPILSASDKEHNKKIFETAKVAVMKGEVCPMIGFDMGEMYKAAEPEIGMYLDYFSMPIYPMLCGYVSGAILVEEVGYSEMVVSSTFLSVQFYLLSDGSIILAAS